MTILTQFQDAVEFFHDTDAEQLANQALYNVLNGLAITEDLANMTVDIALGDYTHNGKVIHVAVDANAVTLVADGSNERWSYVTKDNAGGTVLVSGDAAANGSTEPSKPELGDRVLLKAYKIEAAQTIADSITVKLVKNLPQRPFALNPDQNTIASATTALFPASGGQFFHVTGTTTIAGISEAPYGMALILTFDAVVNLTNSATLILAGGADVATAAGQTRFFVSESVGAGAIWREIAPPARTTQYIGRGPVAGTTSDSWHIVPVWKDTSGIITHCVVAIALSTSTIAVVEYRLAGGRWMHDGVSLGRDAIITLNFTIASIGSFSFFAIDSPGTSSNRILFCAGNNNDATDTYEVDSIDLNDGEGLTAVTVTISGSNQPTDTNLMGTVSCAASTTSLLTIFLDDGHTATITGTEAGFTFDYAAAKVTAISANIDVGGSDPPEAHSLYVIGTQLLLLRQNLLNTGPIAAFSMWEMDTSFSLVTQFLDVEMELGGARDQSLSTRLFPIAGSFGIAVPSALGAAALVGGYTATTFDLDILVGNN